MKNDLDRPGVDPALVEAFDRAMLARVRYHLRQAASLQMINQRTFSDEPELTQDKQGRLVMKGPAPGEWLRMDSLFAIDTEESR